MGIHAVMRRSYSRLDSPYACLSTSGQFDWFTWGGKRAGVQLAEVVWRKWSQRTTWYPAECSRMTIASSRIEIVNLAPAFELECMQITWCSLWAHVGPVRVQKAEIWQILFGGQNPMMCKTKLLHRFGIRECGSYAASSKSLDNWHLHSAPNDISLPLEIL